MTASSIRTPHACLERAVQFKQDAEQLLEISNQWYAVSYFYAAYHAVRASLMVDPIFDDTERLKAVNPNWLPEDRFNDHHQARRGNGVVGAPGVSDMVKELYPDVRVDYSLLHSASIAVRYGLGLSAYEPQAIKDAYEAVAQAAISGGLVAA